MFYSTSEPLPKFTRDVSHTGAFTTNNFTRSCQAWCHLRDRIHLSVISSGSVEMLQLEKSSASVQRSHVVLKQLGRKMFISYFCSRFPLHHHLLMQSGQYTYNLFSDSGLGSLHFSKNPIQRFTQQLDLFQHAPLKSPFPLQLFYKNSLFTAKSSRYDKTHH